MVSTSADRLSTQSPSLQYSTPSMSRISALWMWPHTTPSQPRRRASSVITVSNEEMKFTAFLTWCFRYCDSDQYWKPSRLRIRLNQRFSTRISV